MNSSSLKTAVPILCIGEEARKFLIPGSDGRVLAAFSRAIYLVNAQNALCWLSIENAPMHRRAIQVGARLPRVAVGTPFAVTDQHLSLGSDIVLDFSQTRRWRFAPRYPGRVLLINELYQRLYAIISIIDHLPSAKGFGILIPEILNLLQDQPKSRSNPKLEGAPKYAQPIIREIAALSLTHDFRLMLEFAEELVGLGEGLTPSGDDFIGGLLFCLQSIHHNYGLLQVDGFPGLDSFLRRSESQTNLISFALLKDHATGHGSESLHNLINDLLTGQPLDVLSRSIMGLVQIGHSTGWDLLAGVLTGLLVTVGMSTANTPQVRTSPSYVTS